MALPKSQRSVNLTGTNEGGFSSGLWAKFEKLAPFALYNRFVIALAAGTLEVKYLENYIVQDVYFLKKYVEACKLAEGCEDDTDDKNEYSFTILGEEAVKYAQQLQIRGRIYDEECFPNMVTLKYSNFLLAAAVGKVEGGKGLNPVERTKIPAYTIATMTPCSKLYHFLGQEITRALESNFDHPHREWIEQIFPAEDKGTPLRIEEFLDKLAKPLTREEREVLGRIYYHALKLDIEFFFALPFEQRTLVPLLKQGHSANQRYTIVSDFDLSCTVMDSSAILAEIATLSTLKAQQNCSENPTGRKSSSEIWHQLSRQYSEEYDEWLMKILPPEEVHTFDYQSLYKFLEELSLLEIEANSNFVEPRVLRGLNTNDIEKARELRQILKEINHSKVDMHIISVRWSGEYLKAAFFPGGLDGLHIHSNDMEQTFMESLYFDSVNKHADSSMRKVKIFNNLWSSTKEYDMEHTSIYIGRDNLSDLLCLLKADIGIVIGGSSKLKRVGEHFGVSFVPLFLGLVTQERLYAKCYNGWIRQSGIIYTVSSWSEIHAFLLGPSE